MTDIVRPKAPSSTDDQSRGYSPEQLNPELAQAAMARDLIGKWPIPTFISKKFAVFQGMYRGLNHTEDNKTYFNCEMRLAIYQQVGHQSVNIDGRLFTSIFTYLNKPKLVLQGVNQLASGFEEEKPGFFASLINRFRGGGGTADTQEKK